MKTGGSAMARRACSRIKVQANLIPSRAEAHYVKELVEAIAKALVDIPDQVQVRAIEGEQLTVFELRVHKSDLGKVIGRQGRTAKAIRTILSALGMKLRKRFTLEILD
jgi:predicted RNA-binding protein YlqC (UPF0109 family)